uniref:Borealin C-terminal domain-containing protein n=1 Tax=Davidia involucrata TaxID=16924 RepID=A0A5B7AR66_DAVIN
MAKRRVKKTVKQSASSPSSKIDGAGPENPPIETEKKEDAFRDQEDERRTAAIRAIRDMEIEHLLTGLRLLCSYFKEEQLQTPVLQFFKENLPNLSVVKNGKDGQYEVQWKDRDGNLSMNQDDGTNIHASLLHRMSIAYPDCSAAMPSFGGFEFSSKAVKTSLFGADNLQGRDFVLEEPSDTQMIGLQDGLQTPGVSSQRLSVGMTPKTLRFPKHGEMLLSVHGSPLGVYKEDNMEAIHESEEG